MDKRKETLEQQRSANLAERAKNAAENQSLLDKVTNHQYEIANEYAWLLYNIKISCVKLTYLA